MTDTHITDEMSLSALADQLERNANIASIGGDELGVRVKDPRYLIERLRAADAEIERLNAFTKAVEANAPRLSDHAALMRRAERAEANANGWHHCVETICTILGLSNGLGAGEAAVAVREHAERAEAEVERLKAEREPLANFARQMIRIAWQACDADGGFIQDTAEELGLIKCVPFDPDEHYPNDGDVLLDAGDDWFVFAGPLETPARDALEPRDAKEQADG